MTCFEINPLTMDAAFADDPAPLDPPGADKSGENIGRFCPIYHQDVLPNGTADDYAPPTSGSNPPYSSTWHYHWAMQLFDYLTVEAPHDDYFPDVDPAIDGNGNLLRYVYWNAATSSYIPIAAVNPVANANKNIVNAQPTNAPANPTEDIVPVQGLININTANWKVLSTLPMVVINSANPPWNNIDAAKNAQLAQAIVYYRDVDDGLSLIPGTPHPHGPFKSIFELNAVGPPPGSASNGGFRNAMGYISPPNLGSPGNTDGVLTPDVQTIARVAGAQNTNYIATDFEGEFAVLNRISSLITTRSDSFTVYIIVQGFRNIGTSSPQLAVQRRAAFIADRSGVTPTNSSINSLSVPVN